METSGRARRSEHCATVAEAARAGLVLANFRESEKQHFVSGVLIPP